MSPHSFFKIVLFFKTTYENGSFLFEGPLFVCLTCFIGVSAAFSEEEVNMWTTGLTWLMMDTQRAPAPQQTDRCVQMFSLAQVHLPFCHTAPLWPPG